MGRGPEFKVLQPIVVADAVDVVDGFVGQQFPSDVSLHHKAVFEDAGVLTEAGLRAARVRDDDVAVRVFAAKALTTLADRMQSSAAFLLRLVGFAQPVWKMPLRSQPANEQGSLSPRALMREPMAHR